MIQNLDQMSLLLEEMEKIARTLVQVNVEEEEAQSIIASLQNRQGELRNQINQIIKTEQRLFTEEELQILKTCLELEKEISLNFKAVQHESIEQLERISSGKRTRSLYQHEEMQHMGYFIDKQQ